MPHELTHEEVQKNFLKMVKSYVEYWRDLPGKTTKERLHGLAFGILAILDGEVADLPGFSVKPAPHPDDEAYCKEHGENWYPRGDKAPDIAGDLHEVFSGMR
jgi:hypothetical protein